MVSHGFSAALPFIPAKQTPFLTASLPQLFLNSCAFLRSHPQPSQVNPFFGPSVSIGPAKFFVLLLIDVDAPNLVILLGPPLFPPFKLNLETCRSA